MKYIEAARGKIKADIVLKNCKVVNVFTSEIELADIAIFKDKIVGIGSYKGKREIDINGAYVAPGFIDAHVHIESSMLTPLEFSKLIIPKGTTTIIADPHEIANVCGLDGFNYMIESADNTPLNISYMIPSCVPASKYETNGAAITDRDIKKMLKHPSVHGLGEVMDYFGVINTHDEIMKKIEVSRNYNIDGHAPSLNGNDLNAYVVSGIQTDHECTTVEEMYQKIKRGMYIHLREGSATRNVSTLIKGITPSIINRVMFCTDDKHPYDIEVEGHINYNVNLAIKNGMKPIDAIKIATINAANCYRLYNKGAIAPGYSADLIVFNNINDIQPSQVIINGEIVYDNKKLLFDQKENPVKAVLNTVHVRKTNISFALPLKTNKANIIGLIDDNVTTKHLIEEVTMVDGYYRNNPQDDILKIAVIERHTGSNQVQVGLIKGYGLENGAVGMTIAHDSHNIIIVGDNDLSMNLVLDDLVKMHGGIAIAKGNRLKSHLTLEIGGLMTNKPHESISKRLLAMEEDARKMGVHDSISDPFLTLAFMSLSVIPEIKITDKGLFDVQNQKHIAVGIDN